VIGICGWSLRPNKLQRHFGREGAAPFLCTENTKANPLIKPASQNKEALNTWVVDLAGNIAVSRAGIALLARIDNLHVPVFVSTEQAIEWGSHLSAEQHDTLVDIQRTSSNAACVESNLQRMIDLATKSQLIREAAEAFVPVAVHRRLYFQLTTLWRACTSAFCSGLIRQHLVLKKK